MLPVQDTNKQHPIRPSPFGNPEKRTTCKEIKTATYLLHPI